MILSRFFGLIVLLAALGLLIDCPMWADGWGLGIWLYGIAAVLLIGGLALGALGYVIAPAAMHRWLDT